MSLCPAAATTSRALCRWCILDISDVNNSGTIRSKRVYWHRLVLSWWADDSSSLWARTGSSCTSIVALLCLTDRSPPSLSYHNAQGNNSATIPHAKPFEAKWNLLKNNSPIWIITGTKHPLISEWLKVSPNGVSKDQKGLLVPSEGLPSEPAILLRKEWLIFFANFLQFHPLSQKAKCVSRLWKVPIWSCACKAMPQICCKSSRSTTFLCRAHPMYVPTTSL